MSLGNDERLRVRGGRGVSRAFVAGAGVAALLCGTKAGADPRPGPEWFRSPISGITYNVSSDSSARTKSLVAPDGTRYPTIASVIETESRALTPLERLMPADLRELAVDPERANELVNVTFVYRHQPLHDAGVAARLRAEPALQGALARQHRILDRIAPLRSMPGGRAADVATAMREESALLTDDEKTALRECRDTMHDVLKQMRREILAEAKPVAESEQAALVEYLRGIPEAIDFGGTVTLNAHSARIPARVLGEIEERFPEVLRVERIGRGDGCMDTAAQTVGAGSWWTAGYTGSSNTIIGLLDSGVDGSHPALSNVVTNSAVYHTAASTSSDYGDNSSSTDDLQGHGTNAAGILCSNDSTYTGIAAGALILNAKAAYLNSTTGASTMYFSDGRAAGDWAMTQGATSMLITFGGTGTNAGTDEMALFFDAAASSLGVPGVIAAKNYGPNSGTLGYPGCAFNVITCGNFDDNGTSSHGDDSLYSTSGRGPTSDGRQKPDICAPGVNITTTAHDWETNADFVTISPGTSTGTSMVGPIVAGGYCLLQDYGAATTPEGLKALLLTTAANQSPYGGPDSNWGYGALDLGGAYTYRGSVFEGSLTSTGPRYVLLRGGAVSAGGRATLVWNRQVTSNGANIPTTYYTPQDLDLYAYDESDGSQVGSSTSTVNPNEQIAFGSSVTSPIYKVYRSAASFTSSYSSEPFAVASESTTSTSLVNPPALACTFTELSNFVAASSDTTVTVEVANSGDVAATSPTVTLTLPAGYSITSGDNPQTISGVASQSSGTATWTVHSPAATSSTTVTFSVDASTTSYGETSAAQTATGSQTIDVDAPTATVSIAGGASYTGVRDVSVTLSASDAYSGVKRMRVRNAGDAWGNWVDYATSVNTTLSAGEGEKTFEAEFEDGAGNQSATISDTIVYDITPPSGTVAIQNGADYVNSTSVTLYLSANEDVSGVAEARFSNDGNTWGAWTTFAATTPWTLASGDGTRTVYAQFKDGAGIASTTTTDTIVVDSVAPSGSIAIAGGAAWTTVRGVNLTLAATDAASGVAQMRFSVDGTFFTDWQAYSPLGSWTLSTPDGIKTLYVQFRDAAGNTSAAVSDTIGLDTGLPTGSVTIAGGAKATTTTAVTLSLSATDALNGVAQMRLSNDGTNWGAWITYATSADWTLTSGDGTKTVSAQFKDGVGNVSGTVTDTIVVDTVAPTGTVKVEGDATAVDSTQVQLDLAWADSGSGVADVRMSNDGAVWSDWTPARPLVSWTMDDGDGTHTVRAQFRDQGGNVSEIASDTIVLDTVAPTGTFAVAGGAEYVLPSDTIVVDTDATDGATGTGVVDFRSSFDGGATWSPWSPIADDGTATVPRPTSLRDQNVTVDGQFRDAAGNVSAVASDAAYLIDDQAQDVTLAASFAGTVGVDGDIDAVRMGLVAGDKLSLKLKVKTLVKKADARVEIDVYGPDGTKLVTGRHPSTAKTPGVSNLAAPLTGDYWIVMRASGTAAGTGVTYTMSVKDAPVKGGRAKKGVGPFDAGAAPPSTTVSFDAADGLALGGSLSGPMTTPPTLLGPDGATVTVAVVPGPKGSQKLVPLTLASGTGTYVLTIPATDAVKYALTLTTGKPAKLLE